MPKLGNETMENLKTASNYGFSAVKLDQLGATEYTLVTIACDASGSVDPFRDELIKCLKTALQSCQRSPRVDNLLLRLIDFNTSLREIHGFKLLGTIQESDYDGIINPGGGTALYDAVHTSVEATRDFAQVLFDQEYTANAIVFILTDGMDNSSTYGPDAIGQLIKDTTRSECLEGITVVLVGVDSQNQNVSSYLQRFQQEAGITQFVDIGEATPKKLARLAQFISRSVSSTSQALQSGVASSTLTF